MIKVFFDVRQSAKSNESFSPSAQKPEQVVRYWREQGHPLDVQSFEPCDAETLSLVHSPEYVLGVLECRRANGFGNCSQDVAAALPWVAGSMAAAALFSLRTQQSSFSPTSGAHHARYASGGGFCTFNHLVLAALVAHRAGAKKVGIVDLDCHWGDGTQDIIDQLGLDFILHYSFGRKSPRAGSAADRWLAELPTKFQAMRDCDLILYNAGVDSHIKDPLGGILTTAQMFERDLIVYRWAHRCGIPVVTSLAGGYQRDKQGSIRPVLELHDNTMRAFREVCEVANLETKKLKKSGGAG